MMPQVSPDSGPAALPLKTAPSGHAARPPSEAVFTARDFGLLLGLPLLAAFAWLAPERLKLTFARGAARLRNRMRPQLAAREAAHFAAPFGSVDAERLAEDARTHFYLERLAMLALTRPLAALPQTSVTGRDHLDRALAAGRGAILWVVPTTYATVFAKIACREAGLQVSHLSRPTHGFSRSKIGQLLFNRPQQRLENRFLHGRILIEDGNVRAALTDLTARLAENRIVSITVGTEASKLLSVPLLQGRMSVASRPVDLARRARAALLPMVAISERDGSIVAAIGAPVIHPGDTADEAGDLAAIRRLADFVGPLAAAFPEQFARAKTFHV